MNSSPGLRLVHTGGTGAPSTLVDTNVLLDVATDDAVWAQTSGAALSQAREVGRVLINPIIYAEVSVGYATIEALEEALPPEDYEREALPYVAGFLAGKAFLAYRRRGGNKTSPLADFYIGAHAATNGYQLLTRDTSRYRTYFPTVKLVVPEG